MSATVNRERMNDAPKLIMHVIITHQLMRNPSLIEHARQSLTGITVRFPERLFIACNARVRHTGSSPTMTYAARSRTFSKGTARSSTSHLKCSVS
jgi:hypothetical protein